MKKMVFVSSSILLSFLPIAGPVRSQAVAQTDVSRDQLVATVRNLNTAEVLYLQETGRFASLDDMLGFLRKKDYLKTMPINLENTKAVELRITTTLDGAHYQLGIRQASEKSGQKTGCNLAAFSNDSGLIYLGTPLGCN
ncbi:MAG TPA: hypothetical protein VE263_11720 [Candidatus Angelobacter sp.]|nr:hypothetical protein [Candidatus Angelobacter sp.]